MISWTFLWFSQHRGQMISGNEKIENFPMNYQLTLWQSSGGVAGGDKSNPESIFLNISAVLSLTDNPFI